MAADKKDWIAMVGDTAQSQMDKELVAWIDSIPFSKPARNLTRDFSDAVLMAELLKLYYPRYVELHNYVPASNLNMKKENWNTLNRKVLAKLNMRLNKDMIHCLANASQGMIEKLLLELRIKVLTDGVEMQKPRLVKNDIENVEQMSKKKIEGSNMLHDDQFNLSEESSDRLDTDNKICQSNMPKSSCFKRGIFIVFSWITYLFRILNILNYCRLPRFGKHKCNMLMDVAIEQIENINDETVPRTICTELKQELREKEEVICTLSHKIVYLESSMKLKELRISSLTAQILQNAVEMDHSAKSPLNDGARAKLRSRSHNFHESRTN